LFRRFSAFDRLTFPILNLRIDRGKSRCKRAIRATQSLHEGAFAVKAVITDHHYTDIAGAARVLADAGIECVVGGCRSEDDAIALGRDADAVINQHVALTERVLDAWPRCRGVVHFGKGVDNIDVAAATRRGIWVANVRDANWDEVSNHVLALLLAWARGLFVFDRDVRAGRWSHRAAVPRHRLAGQVLGIVGFGDIARVLAAKAHGIGLTVLAHARRPAAADRVAFVDFDDLLRRSDYVSIHVPLAASTVKLIGARELALMKRSAFLINTSRGGVVDQPALVEALRSRRIAGAGLDVTDPEPPARDDPLLALDNVIVTPHVAWYSEESREHVTVHAALEVVRILHGERPRSPVNPEVVPRRPPGGPS
jgi:D-3-phosphoglycerate dehydrogenase